MDSETLKAVRDELYAHMDNLRTITVDDPEELDNSMEGIAALKTIERIISQWINHLEYKKEKRL